MRHIRNTTCFLYKGAAYLRFSESDVPIAGGPLEIYGKNDESESIEWHLQLHKFLHIAKMKIVSSQFCELVGENTKWERREGKR